MTFIAKKDLFTSVATAQEKVNLANDLLLINHLQHIDNINDIDDKFFKSITSVGTSEKKAKVVATINLFLEDASTKLAGNADPVKIKEAAEKISKEIKLKDNFQKIANDLLLINHLQHIGNIGNIDDKFFKSITLVDSPPATDEEKKAKVVATINLFLDGATKLDGGADLDKIKKAAEKISKTINLTDLFSEEGIPLNDEIKNKLYDRGLTAEKLIGFATREITQDNLKLDLRISKLFGENINILKGNTLSKEDKRIIVNGITRIIEEAGQDKNKKNVVAAILPIVSLLDDGDFKNNKDAILNSLIKRSYKEEAIKSIFKSEEVGKNKIDKARQKDWSSYRRESETMQEVGLDHTFLDAAQHYMLEVAFYSVGSVVSLAEGFARGFVAPIASAVSAVGFEFVGGEVGLAHDLQLGLGGRFDNLKKSHSWARIARNKISRDGGHDLEQKADKIHRTFKGVGFAVGVIPGVVLGAVGFCAGFLIAKAVKKTSGSYEEETDLNARISLTTLNVGTEVDIKISDNKKKIEFTDVFQGKIQEEQAKQVGLIKISEKQNCYIGVGLKFKTSDNKVDANKGYIEVNDVYRDNDECGGKKIKKGDKISKITVGKKEIDFINGTFTEDGTVTDINLDDVGEKLAELLLKTPRDTKVSLTVVGKDKDIELDKKVFIKNDGGRKLSDGLNHDFVSIDKANDKDITSAFNKFNGSKTVKTKAKSPAQTIRQAMATQALEDERGSRR